MYAIIGMCTYACVCSLLCSLSVLFHWLVNIDMDVCVFSDSLVSLACEHRYGCACVCSLSVLFHWLVNKDKDVRVCSLCVLFHWLVSIDMDGCVYSVCLVSLACKHR